VSLICLLLLLLSRKLIPAAFLLFAVLLTVGALYVFLGAEFLAVSQLVVYVGGILVLMMFGIMLTERDGNEEKGIKLRNLVPAIFLCASILTGLVLTWSDFISNPPSWMRGVSDDFQQPDNIEQIGAQSLGKYILPFEFASVLLLLCLIGAAYIARRKVQEDAH